MPSIKYLSAFLILLSFSISLNKGFAQCSVTVDVPADITICESELVDLQGIVNGPYLFVEWEGTNGFSDNNIITSDLPTESTSYTFTAYAATDINLVVNGDFEAGNTGFSSDYLLAETNCIGSPWGLLGCEGMYTINSDASNTHVNFPACTDHTSGAGNMMIVNGSPNQSDIWCQNIVVQPNTDYLFSAWATSIVGDSPALLQFSINGSLIGNDFNLTSTTCFWENFTTTWNSGGNTNATICVTNQNTAVGGNDFALDDIEFLEVCKDEKTVDVTFSEVLGTIPTSSIINCDDPIVNIEITPSSSNYNYIWIANFGGVIEGPTNTSSIQASHSGLYTVTIIDQNGCSKELVTTVNGNTDPPQSDIIGDFEISCENNEVLVLATNTDNGNTYEWVGSTDNSNQSFANYDTPGSYYVQITNSANCVAFIPFDITSNITAPNYDLPTPDVLSCIGDSTIISIDISNTPDNMSWTDPDGNYLGDNNSVVVSDVGYYTINFEYDNGCSFSDSVLVLSQISSFNYNLGESPELTCETDTANLLATLIDPYSEVSWIYNDQSTIGSSINVHEAGTYVLEIIDMNGCVTRDTTIVTIDTTLASYSLNSTEINCVDGFGELEINSSDNITATWELPDGTNDNGLSINSAQSGFHLINIQNENGCISIDSILLEANQDYPVLSFEYDSLNCIKNDASVEVSSNIQNTSFSWSGPSNFTSTQESFVVNNPGTYIITAIADNGCEIVDSIVIEIDTISPIIEFTSDTINCINKEVLINFNNLNNLNINSVTGPNLISFNNDHAIVSEAGEYTIELTGDNGCMSMLTEVVESDLSLPMMQSTSDTITCSKATATISLINPEEYQVINVMGNGVIEYDDTAAQISSGGIYNIEFVGHNGCTNTISNFVFSDTLSPTIPSLPEIKLDCNTPDSSINIPPISDYNFSLVHNSDTIQGTQFNIDSSFGEYIIQVTDLSNGCITKQQLNINYDFDAPTFSIEATDINCINTMSFITFDISSSYDNIFSFDGLDTDNSNNYIADMSGNYSFEVTYENGCKSTNEIDIIENINYPEVTTSDYGFGCNKEPLILTADVDLLDISYQWEGPENINSSEEFLTTAIAGKYFITVTDNLSGCATLDSIIVEPYVNSLAFDLKVNPPPCFGKSGNIEIENIIGGNPPFDINIWNETSTNIESPDNLPAGSYILDIIDADGCDTLYEFSIDEPKALELNLENDITINFNEDVQLYSSSNIPEGELMDIVWEPETNLSCSDCPDPYIVNLKDNINYTVTYIDENGCEVSSSIVIRVLKDFSIYQPTIFTPNNDGVNDIFYLQTNEYGENSILSVFRIYDRWGNLMFEIENGELNNPDYGWDGTFQGSTVNPGVYVYYLNIILPDNSVKTISGDITIIR